MDLITTSLHTYLKCVGLKFHAKCNFDCGTSTNIETQITGVNMPISILSDINSTNFSISITLFPFFLLDCQNINIIRAIQDQWNAEQRISQLIIIEEGGVGIGKCFSVQIRINILSDANGLTRSLWHKYFERLFIETAQVCNLAYKLKNETDDVDILTM